MNLTYALIYVFLCCIFLFLLLFFFIRINSNYEEKEENNVNTTSDPPVSVNNLNTAFDNSMLVYLLLHPKNTTIKLLKEKYPEEQDIGKKVTLFVKNNNMKFDYVNKCYKYSHE